VHTEVVAADWDLVTRERAALIDLFDGLGGDQWQVASLCPGWTVKHVLAHLASALDASTALSLKVTVAAVGRPAVLIDKLAKAYVDRPTDELVATYRRHVDSTFAPPGMGWRASLTDVMVHRMDVALPLGADPQRPPDAWRPVLEFLTSGMPMLGSIRGGRPKACWRTTDLDWTAGRGPAVSGTAEDIGLTLSGRAAQLERLEGAGVPLVARWLGE
jgi:uncharacterized protein (TIGR03083 family)